MTEELKNYEIFKVARNKKGKVLESTPLIGLSHLEAVSTSRSWSINPDFVKKAYFDLLDSRHSLQTKISFLDSVFTHLTFYEQNLVFSLINRLRKGLQIQPTLYSRPQMIQLLESNPSQKKRYQDFRKLILSHFMMNRMDRFAREFDIEGLVSGIDKKKLFIRHYYADLLETRSSGCTMADLLYELFRWDCTVTGN